MRSGCWGLSLYCGCGALTVNLTQSSSTKDVCRTVRLQNSGFTMASHKRSAKFPVCFCFLLGDTIEHLTI